MSSALVGTPAAAPSSSARPSARRRLAVAAAGFLACAIPVAFTVSIVGQLMTGAEPADRFHQLTGQGLLLTSLWLAGLVPTLLAGWRGAVPSSAAILHSGVVVTAALAVGAVAPGGGALTLAVVAAITTALLWAALPVGPKLRGTFGQLDPLIAAVTAATGVVMAPFILSQLALQNSAVDEHAEAAHYFDMAWVSVILVLLGVVAAAVPAARGQVWWMTGGVLLIGATRLAFTADVTWSLLAITTGAAGSALLLVSRRHSGPFIQSVGAPVMGNDVRLGARARRRG